VCTLTREEDWSESSSTGSRPERYAGGASLRFPLVIFMLVKKASDLLLQLRRVARLTYGNGVFEELPLGGRRQIIPLQEYRRPKAL